MRSHASAEIEGDTVEMIAGAGGTLRAAFLQAGDMRIAKIPAARTLGEIAAERGEMTDLRGGETKRRGGKTGISLCDAGVGCDRGDGGEGADARSAVRAPAYPDGVGRGGNIDQRSLRNAAAPAFGEVGAGGAEFGCMDGCGCHAAVLPCSAAMSRSGRIGSSVSRIPVALQMALAMAGDVGTVATSPMPTLPPSTWSKPPSSKCTSIGGVSAIPGMR